MRKRSADDPGSSGAEELESEGILDLLSSPRAKTSPSDGQTNLSAPVDGIVIGNLVRLGKLGEAYVTLPGSEDTPLPARSLTPLQADQIGRAVALMFEAGDPSRPILMGVVHDPVEDLIARRDEPSESALPPISAQLDDESIVIEAQRQIVLRCGKASITLSPDGKIRIRGTDVLSRSSGRHRIKGGSVAIN
jgi:hypothetical protein